MSSDKKHSSDWLLDNTSTMYMSGNAVYLLRRYGKPGVIASIELSTEIAQEFRESLLEHDAMIRADAWDKGYKRGEIDHCDYWGSISEPCGVSSSNPYRQPRETQEKQE